MQTRSLQNALRSSQDQPEGSCIMSEDFSSVLVCFVPNCQKCPEPSRFPGRTYVDTRKRMPKRLDRTEIPLADPREQRASVGSINDCEAGSHSRPTDAPSAILNDSYGNPDDDPRDAKGIPAKSGRPRRWSSEAERLRSYRRKIQCEGQTGPMQ